jgi:hypothetical protein
MTKKPLPAATVFISYAHADRERVQPIARAFEKWEWNVSSDLKDENISDAWRDTYRPLVGTAYTLLVAWSETSVKSTAVKEEVKWALERHNRLKFFPVKIDAVQAPDDMWIAGGVDLSEWNGDPDDPLFERVRVGIENEWSLENHMALIRDMTAMKTLRFKTAARSDIAP